MNPCKNIPRVSLPRSLYRPRETTSWILSDSDVIRALPCTGQGRVLVVVVALLTNASPMMAGGRTQ